MKNDNRNTANDWLLYEKGREYNRRIGLYDTVNKNERFYRGDQWNGVVSGGLPTPVFNIFKRVINYFISSIMSQKIALRFHGEDSGDSFSGGVYKSRFQDEITEASTVISSYLNYKMEKDKIDSLFAQGLLDAAITGDMFLYIYWDRTKRTPQEFMGDFITTLVDGTNVFFGDVNIASVQNQPYIIISGRELVDSLRAEAKRNGADEDQAALIISDSDTEGEAGDYAKNELDGTKCTYIIKLFRENGTVRYTKCTKNAVICKNVDTGLRLYPLAMMNWDKVKNSYHGQAAATGLIENQIYINKAFAMVMKHMMNVSFSKVIYNANMIDEWSNGIGEAIAVNGPIENVASTIDPGTMQSGFLDVINMTIAVTKDLMGATDAALGNVKPDNTSAIIALQQSSALPLENQRRALFSLAEDLGMIWLDFILNYYDSGRTILYRENGEAKRANINTEKFRDVLFSCSVDAGVSAYWSEIATVNTLDNLLGSGKIDFIKYLERMPDGFIPRKKELIDEEKEKLKSANKL